MATRKESSKEQQVQKNAPLKVFRVDDVSASIFGRQVQVRGELQTFYSVSFTRSYRDSSGSWKYSKSFSLDDLGKIVSVAQQSDSFIREHIEQSEE